LFEAVKECVGIQGGDGPERSVNRRTAEDKAARNKENEQRIQDGAAGKDEPWDNG